MTFNEERIRHLLRLFADNKATEQETTELLNLLRQKKGDSELESFMMELRRESDSYISPLSVDWEGMWGTIHQSAIRPVTPVRKMKWLKVAAAIITSISISAYYFNQGFNGNTKKQTVKIEPVQQQKNDASPGGNKAILTLANGAQIILDSVANGTLAQQGSTKVIKLANGQLNYKRIGGQTDEVLYNTMSTPYGGQYRLVLPDGSGVWLNAVSSIRFPTAFTGEQRRVEITGEAYFEIAEDISRPFKVSVIPSSGRKGMEVEVLGTHFNINAYEDEPTVKTTLLKGSVKVSSAASRTIIKPGQQSALNNSGELKILYDADMDEAVAWKDGRFEFKDADLKTIMRQVMRWYDVEVEYKGNISERYFTADISRNKTLSGVLKILELSDIDFKLEGKKLTVTP